MSTIEGIGKSVNNNLILYYDSVNPKSYSGSGTVISDLSTKQYNSSLINGVGYSDNSFTFDGVDDYVLVDYSDEIYNLQVPMTIMGWFNEDGSNPRPTIFSQYLNSTPGNLVKLVRMEGGTFSYYPSKSSSPGFQVMQFLGAYQPNTWTFFSVTVSGNLTASNIVLTVNENSQSFTASQMATPNTSVEVRIGVSESTFLQSQEFFSGNISRLLIYNRALDQTEINSYYLKTKTKFL